MSYYLGLDGGGTKTEAAVVDAAGRVLGEGRAGASNPLRAGFARALTALVTASSRALAAARAHPRRVRAVCAGLAGAGRPVVTERVTAFLSHRFSGARTEVVADVEIALDSIAETGPALVVVAGTGSAAFGRDGSGRKARAGGLGPWFSDEGSAFDIGRQALAALVRVHDAAGPATVLERKIGVRLNARIWGQLIEEITSKPLERLPEIFPAVVEAAETGDPIAQAIIAEAAGKLAALAETVIGRLGLRRREFALGRVGGVFGRSRFLDERLDARLAAHAPRARFTAPRFPPSVAAANRALRAALPADAGKPTPA